MTEEEKEKLKELWKEEREGVELTIRFFFCMSSPR